MPISLSSSSDSSGSDLGASESSLPEILRAADVLAKRDRLESKSASDDGDDGDDGDDDNSSTESMSSDEENTKEEKDEEEDNKAAKRRLFILRRLFHLLEQETSQFLRWDKNHPEQFEITNTQQLSKNLKKLFQVDTHLPGMTRILSQFNFARASAFISKTYSNNTTRPRRIVFRHRQDLFQKGKPDLLEKIKYFPRSTKPPSAIKNKLQFTLGPNEAIIPDKTDQSTLVTNAKKTVVPAKMKMHNPPRARNPVKLFQPGTSAMEGKPEPNRLPYQSRRQKMVEAKKTKKPKKSKPDESEEDYESDASESEEDYDSEVNEDEEEPPISVPNGHAATGQKQKQKKPEPLETSSSGRIRATLKPPARSNNFPFPFPYPVPPMMSPTTSTAITQDMISRVAEQAAEKAAAAAVQRATKKPRSDSTDDSADEDQPPRKREHKFMQSFTQWCTGVAKLIEEIEDLMEDSEDED